MIEKALQHFFQKFFLRICHQSVYEVIPKVMLIYFCMHSGFQYFQLEHSLYLKYTKVGFML